MTTMVTVTVPEGIYEGQEFLLEYEGQQLAVICPDGCAGGDDIDLEVPIATGGAAAPNLVDVAVPDGCLAGSEFTVTFGDEEFNITVPDGVNPGEMMTVEVPAAAAAEDPTAVKSPPWGKSPWGKSPAALTKSPGALIRDSMPQDDNKPANPPKGRGLSQKNKPQKMDLLEIPAFKGASAGDGGNPKKKPSASKYLAGLDIPAYKGPLKGVTANSVNSHAKWDKCENLFDMGPDQGYGRAAGDFHIGQLVQVMRSNGAWTYGKMMDYDPSGDTYSVMTKAGAKHFVERDDITAETLENPGTGGCAQQ